MSDLPQNLIPNEMSLGDLLDLVKRDIFLSLNCHAIGTIQSFDSDKQTAQATINYKKTYFDSELGSYKPVLVDYPQLIDCPVVVLGGGSGALTFPIAEGDECLVLFNDRDLDNWFGGSSGSAVATPRLHSFSDGLILVGVRSLANVIPSYAGNAVEIRTKDGSSKISVNTSTGAVTINVGSSEAVVQITTDGKISMKSGSAGLEFDATATGTLSIKNGVTTTDLITALYTILTTATAAGFPLVVDPTSIAVLASLKP